MPIILILCSGLWYSLVFLLPTHPAACRSVPVPEHNEVILEEYLSSKIMWWSCILGVWCWTEKKQGIPARWSETRSKLWNENVARHPALAGCCNRLRRVNSVGQGTACLFRVCTGSGWMAPAALRLEHLCATAAQTIRQWDKPKCSERMIRPRSVSASAKG